jgi:hypothetical protein
VEMNLCLNIDSEDRNGVSANSYPEIKKKSRSNAIGFISRINQF